RSGGRSRRPLSRHLARPPLRPHDQRQYYHRYHGDYHQPEGKPRGDEVECAKDGYYQPHRDVVYPVHLRSEDDAEDEDPEPRKQEYRSDSSIGIQNVEQKQGQRQQHGDDKSNPQLYSQLRVTSSRVEHASHYLSRWHPRDHAAGPVFNLDRPIWRPSTSHRARNREPP